MKYTAKASINLPIDTNIVWRYLSDLRNFSRFLSNVREVRATGKDLWEWRLKGVLGIPLFCKTTSILKESSKRIIWDLLNGSIASYGWIKIDGSPSGSTITMSLTYSPPSGVVNEIFNKMFKDPQKILEHDLEKLRHLLSLNQSETLFLVALIMTHETW